MLVTSVFVNIMGNIKFSKMILAHIIVTCLVHTDREEYQHVGLLQSRESKHEVCQSVLDEKYTDAMGSLVFCVCMKCIEASMIFDSEAF